MHAAHSGYRDFSGQRASVEPQVIGNSRVFQHLQRLIHRVASTDRAVLISGPTGSGKEVAAQMLHRLGSPGLPFIDLNCGAIPENLLEAELFGCAKGAFTGAVSNRAKDAKEVSLGIVAALKKQGVQAQAKQSNSGDWLVLVGTVKPETNEFLTADPVITANITIAANTSDIPATINALNGFFGNWRAVAGLIATGAAVVAGRWLMTIQRQP